MVLRASIESTGGEVNLQGIVDPTVTLGVAAGDELVEFADAVLGPDTPRLARARVALNGVLGPHGVLGASAIAANFSRNDRIANAIGIPLEKEFVEQSADFRATLGINAFASARNTLG